MPLLIYRENGERDFTRDVFWSPTLRRRADAHHGQPLGEPQRRGVSTSQPFRNAAAMICKNTRTP